MNKWLDTTILNQDANMWTFPTSFFKQASHKVGILRMQAACEPELRSASACCRRRPVRKGVSTQPGVLALAVAFEVSICTTNVAILGNAQFAGCDQRSLRGLHPTYRKWTAAAIREASGGRMLHW